MNAMFGRWRIFAVCLGIGLVWHLDSFGGRIAGAGGAAQAAALPLALPVDELTAFAVPAEVQLGTDAEITAITLSSGAPASDRLVEFSLNHGQSGGHATLIPPAAVTNAGGAATVIFRPDRPGTIHLKASCEGAAATVKVKVRP